MPLANQVGQSAFLQRSLGSFTGILKWQQLDDLWQVLKAKADAGWYVYVVGDDLPVSTVSADHLCQFITEMDILLKKEHQQDYCGLVYVDDVNDPGFIKIYHPNNLGGACSTSKAPPLPGWILSLLKPEDLAGTAVLTSSRMRWWRRIFSRN